MKIAIVGAGGVGGYYGAVLARAGHDVTALARGDHLSAIRDGGIEVLQPDGNRFTAPVQATDQPGSLAGADLAVVAVKSYSLPELAPALARLGRGGTTILPLLNGVDITQRLVDQGVPAVSLLAGLTYISAARVAPGQIERRSEFQRIVLGEPDGGASDRAVRVSDAFSATDIDVRVSADMETELWRKLVFIATLAAACGLARGPVGVVRDAPLGATLLARAAAEVVAVARARGVRVDEDEGESVVQRIQGLDPALRPSFLLDLEAGGPTELDILSATISRLGSEAGVPTPVHDTAWTALSRS